MEHTVDLEELRRTQALATELLTEILRQGWSTRELWGDRITPCPGDWERVFLPEWADRARQGYAQWALEQTLLPEPGPDAASVSISGVIPAFMFATENAASRQHAGGFRGVARALQPDRHWVSWRFERWNGGNGPSYGGLVRVEGERFAWFPKPWMVLR